MSCETAASEKEPLLAVASYDVSNSNNIDSRDNRTVGHTAHVAVNGSHLQVFKRRWYILILFSLVSIGQTVIWNTWGPLAQSAEVAFGWSLSEIALLTNWGCIMYVSSTVFFSWLMDVKGMLFLSTDHNYFISQVPRNTSLSKIFFIESLYALSTCTFTVKI